MRLFVMSKRFLLAPCLLALLCIVGCQPFQSPATKRAGASKAAPARAFERDDPAVPFVAVRLYYGDAASVKKLLEAQDDSVVRFKGMRRVGSGVLSVGVRDGRGHWVESYECGGHLFVTGVAGQPCQIVVRNDSRVRLEIVAGMDGADAVSGGAFQLENHGLVLAPVQTSILGQVKRGGVPTLRFGAGRPPSLGPVIEAKLAPSNGSILLAVFQEKGRLPWEGTIRMGTRTTTGKFPQRRYEPDPLSTEYR